MPSWRSLLKAQGIFTLYAAAILTALTVVCSCSTVSPTPEAAVVTTVPDARAPTETPRAADTADPWMELLQNSPYPYATPLPPSVPTALDGIYTKTEPKEGTPVPCRRCPDYLAEGGLWRLSLAKGAFKIFHPFTGWRSLGSFVVTDDRFVIFNDPACYDVVGVYSWQLQEGRLRFTLIEDPCQVGRRANSFSNAVWEACRSPSSEAATTSHWPEPVGCDSLE